MQAFNIVSFVLIVVALTAVFSGPLICSEISLDSYGRHSGRLPTSRLEMTICLPSDLQIGWFSAATQYTIALLSAVLAWTCLDITVDLYFKLTATHGGVSVSLAELLLNVAAPSTKRGTWSRLVGAVTNEPRSNMFLKVFVVVGTLIAPVFMMFLSPLATAAYSAITIRYEQFNVNVSSIPAWISNKKLREHGWLDEAVINRPYDAFSPFGGTGNLTDWTVDGPGTRTPSNYEGHSLYQFLTDASHNQRMGGSGLQTMSISVPAESSPRQLGIIPLANMLLTPGVGAAQYTGSKVPADTKDFQIEQSVLVIDQNCSVFSSAALEAIKGSKPWKTINSTFWDVELLMEATSHGIFNIDHDFAKFIDVINGTTGTHSQVWVRSGKDHAYNTSAIIPLHYSYEWVHDTATGKPTSVLTYTASPVVHVSSEQENDMGVAGMLCKTALFPIAFNTTIPPGCSSILTTGGNYMPVPFTPRSQQLLDQALALTSDAIKGMGRDGSYLQAGTKEAGMPYPVMSRIIKQCPRGSIIANGIYPHAKRAQAGPTTLVYNFSHDSCASSEFDRLLKAHLTYLSYIPEEEPPKAWAWGAAALYHVPNRYFCIKIVTLLLAMGALVIALVLAARLRSSMSDDVDMTAPWSIQLAELLDHYGSRRVVPEACVLHHDLSETHGGARWTLVVRPPAALQDQQAAKLKDPASTI